MADTFRKGRHSTLTLFIKGSKVAPLTAESYDLKQDADDIADGVNGESRDRLDKEIKFYTLTIKCFNENADKLKELLSYDEALDDDEQKAVQFGLKLKEQSGSSSFTLTECVIGGWSWAGGQRTARAMLDIPIRARFCKLLS
jgi:hypothetical protein